MLAIINKKINGLSVQSVLCKMWLEEGECRTLGCTFAHGKKELSQASAGTDKSHHQSVNQPQFKKAIHSQKTSLCVQPFLEVCFAVSLRGFFRTVLPNQDLLCSAEQQKETRPVLAQKCSEVKLLLKSSVERKKWVLKEVNVYIYSSTLILSYTSFLLQRSFPWDGFYSLVLQVCTG